MTDHELLELAAKAAGMHLTRAGYIVDGDEKNPIYSHPDYAWNPLTDDGDAFRLAVKLGMIVSIINHPKLLQVEATAYPPDHRPEGRMALEPLGADHLAATRRAIVRAAAQIGRSMK